MTTKCAKFLFCWHVVTASTDNTLKTNKNNPKLIFQKISKRNYTESIYVRKFTLRTL